MSDNTVPGGVTPRTAFEFAAVTLIWGSTWLVIKGQLGVVPPSWSVAYRFLIAGVLMVAVCLATRRWQRPSRAAHGFALIAGVMQFFLNFNLVYASEHYLTSGLVALVFALLIVPNTLFARVFLGVPITRRFVVGATIGIAGLALVFARDLLAPGGSSGNLVRGVGLIGLAVLSASTANIMQATSLARTLPTLPTLALTMLYGSLFNVGYALLNDGAPVFDGRPEYWLGLAYLAIVASVAAFSFYYSLIRRIGPGPAAYSSVIIPVVAMTLSTLFEGYRWTPAAAAGGAMAMFGLVVALSGRRSSAAGAQAGAEVRIAQPKP